MSAGAVAVAARRERTRSATASRRLDISFLAVFTRNTVSGTTDAADGSRSTSGYGIQSHYRAKATLEHGRPRRRAAELRIEDVHESCPYPSVVHGGSPHLAHWVRLARGVLSTDARSEAGSDRRSGGQRDLGRR